MSFRPVSFCAGFLEDQQIGQKLQAQAVKDALQRQNAAGKLVIGDGELIALLVQIDAVDFSAELDLSAFGGRHDESREFLAVAETQIGERRSEFSAAVNFPLVLHGRQQRRFDSRQQIMVSRTAEHQFAADLPADFLGVPGNSPGQIVGVERAPVESLCEDFAHKILENAMVDQAQVQMGDIGRLAVHGGTGRDPTKCWNGQAANASICVTLARSGAGNNCAAMAGDRTAALE